MTTVDSATVPPEESGRSPIWDEPRWWFFLLLPLWHFASLSLTSLCAAAADDRQIFVWLPNAVLLAALLRFRGRRGWLMACLFFGVDMAARMPRFSPTESGLLSLVDLVEVITAYGMMRRGDISSELACMRDLTGFLTIGPCLSALLGGLLEAAVIQSFETHAIDYVTLARIWWFGDGLGLLVYTPLLLTFMRPARESVHLLGSDYLVLLLTAGLGLLILLPAPGEAAGLTVTPLLLLPSILFIASRFGMRWTSVAIMILCLAIAWMLSVSRDPFGSGPLLRVVRAQEFMVTASIIGLSIAVLRRQWRFTAHYLENKLRDRSRALEEANGKLAALNTTDNLTGLVNRRRFDEVLAIEWNRARRGNQALCVALIDIDWFKRYNDYYGHQLGDDCLQRIGRLLKARVHRSSDLIARYGGEQFALLAPSTESSGALSIAHSICEAIEALRMPHQASPFGTVTLSIGVAAMIPGEYETEDFLLVKASAALARAKKQGRNQAVLADIVVPGSTAGLDFV